MFSWQFSLSEAIRPDTNPSLEPLLDVLPVGKMSGLREKYDYALAIQGHHSDDQLPFGTLREREQVVRIV